MIGGMVSSGRAMVVSCSMCSIDDIAANALGCYVKRSSSVPAFVSVTRKTHLVSKGDWLRPMRREKG